MNGNQDASVSVPLSQRERELRTSEWAESEEFEIPADVRISRGDEAAAEGRAMLIAALGSEDAVRAAVSGRPSLSGTVGVGPSPKRQVRLPIDLDQALTARAERENKRASEIIRDALDAYLNAS